MTPNRIVVAATALLSLLGAVLPVLANMDWTSTAGVFAGLISLDAVVIKWLEGWQAHEARGGAVDSVRRRRAPRP